MSTPQFHPLTVSDIRPETSDSVSVAFTVPAHLRAAYHFTQGQFLTLKAQVNGQELRRAYSICVGVPEYEAQGDLRVGIKRVAGGAFSNWVNDQLKVGQQIEVMTPDGRFFSPLNASHAKHYVGFAGGSGITPMLSLIKTSLAQEPNSQFTLLYGNRTVNSVMFGEELEDLKNRYLSRLRLYHVLSDEPQEFALQEGLLNQEKCSEFLQHVIPARSIDEAFICGPAPMMDAAEAALKAAGIAAQHIHVERFGSFTVTTVAKIEDATPAAELTIVLDGKERKTRVGYDGDNVLDAGLRLGMNLPYSCKGGNCSTCRAKVLEGTVKMLKNFALNQEEVEAGFVLTCQCVPLGDKVKISFDER